MKKCYACGRTLPADAFGRNRSKPDGLACECRECKRKIDAASHARSRKKRLAKMRAYWQENLERLRAKARDYSRSEQGRERNNVAKRRYYYRHREAIAARTRRYVAEHPDRYVARYKLMNAVKLGHIIRPGACQKCGTVGPAHAHHHDYSKPFDVQWLCRKCHGIIHRTEVGSYD